MLTDDEVWGSIMHLPSHDMDALYRAGYAEGMREAARIAVSFAVAQFAAGSDERAAIHTAVDEILGAAGEP